MEPSCTAGITDAPNSITATVAVREVPSLIIAAWSGRFPSNPDYRWRKKLLLIDRQSRTNKIPISATTTTAAIIFYRSHPYPPCNAE